MNAFLKSVRETPAEMGEAVLWWLGQMGLLIKMGETVLCIDYYASPAARRQVNPPVPAEEVTGIDAFLGTHNHLDHMDHMSWRLWARQCPDALFVFPGVHAPSVLEDGVTEERMRGMNDGESCSVGDITIRALAAAHEFIDRDPVTGQVPALQYIIEGNGLRIYHAGDTLRYEGMLPALKAFGPIDAALLPINGRDGERYRRDCIGNMTYQEAVDLAGELRPGMVIPGHWDMFRNNPGDPDAFEDYLDAKYPGKVRCVRPRHGEPVRVIRQR
ncbi:MAG: MBL fold metallo-hydrolase [Clostridia bacterium]|nr:MBL fold metallo-hydrolase [Clostridia bacterium]